MEDELNYLSKMIEAIEIDINKATSELNCYEDSQKVYSYYEKEITSLEIEKQMLNNILTALTIGVIETQKVNKRVEDLDKNINWD